MVIMTSQMSSHHHQRHQIQLQTSQKTCHQLLKSLKVTEDHQIPQGEISPTHHKSYYKKYYLVFLQQV